MPGPEKVPNINEKRCSLPHDGRNWFRNEEGKRQCNGCDKIYGEPVAPHKPQYKDRADNSVLF
jgi:hypothetical protein